MAIGIFVAAVRVYDFHSGFYRSIGCIPGGLLVVSIGLRSLCLLANLGFLDPVGFLSSFERL